MSKTIRHIPARYLRRPRGIRAALRAYHPIDDAPRLRPGAIPPHTFDDIPVAARKEKPLPA